MTLSELRRRPPSREKTPQFSRRTIVQLMLGGGTAFGLGGLFHFFTETERLDLRNHEVVWDSNPEKINEILSQPKLMLCNETKSLLTSAYFGFDINQLQPRIYTVVHSAVHEFPYLSLPGQPLEPFNPERVLFSPNGRDPNDSAAYKVSENTINYLTNHNAPTYIRSKRIGNELFPGQFVITQNFTGDTWLALRVLRISSGDIFFHVAGKINGVPQSVFEEGVFPSMSGSPAIPAKLKSEGAGSYRVEALASCAGYPISIGEVAGVFDSSIEEIANPNIVYYEYRPLTVDTSLSPQYAGLQGTTVGVINRSDTFRLRNVL